MQKRKPLYSLSLVGLKFLASGSSTLTSGFVSNPSTTRLATKTSFFHSLSFQSQQLFWNSCNHLGSSENISGGPNFRMHGIRRSRRLRGLAASAISSSSNQEKDADKIVSVDISKECPKSEKYKGVPKRKRSTRSSTTAKTASTESSETGKEQIEKITSKKKTSTTEKKKPRKRTSSSSDSKKIQALECLPRLREEELKQSHEGYCKDESNDSNTDEVSTSLQVIGVDEAGRGPLAGPVVAAAAIITLDIPGVTDSKKINKEETREELYEKVISSPNAKWAVAISDAPRIDDINILQATLEAMRNAVTAIIHNQGNLESNVNDLRIEKEASAKMHPGCYVVCHTNDHLGNQMHFDVSKPSKSSVVSDAGTEEKSRFEYYALIDGNKVPKEMPCEAESMVKGDSKEYAIAAASIIAKVTRDRLMREYDTKYPQYNLSQHKGYPTAAHMAVVRKLGATPIHRRTFAPLKHMVFDQDGGIIEDNN